MNTRNSQRKVALFVPEQSEENDPDLWPGGSGPDAAWRVGPHPALADVGWEWIEPYLLPYYRRTAKRDAEVVAIYKDPCLIDDRDNLLHRNGRPVPVDPSTEHGRSLICHFHALRDAKDRLGAEIREGRDRARDVYEFTCVGCAVVDRDRVRPRSVGAWVHPSKVARIEVTSIVRGPNLCPSCGFTLELLVEERVRSRAEDAAVEVLPDGRSRRDACGTFLDGHVERIMGA